jgi:hypothetical protein
MGRRAEWQARRVAPSLPLLLSFAIDRRSAALSFRAGCLRGAARKIHQNTSNFRQVASHQSQMLSATTLIAVM